MTGFFARRTETIRNTQHIVTMVDEAPLDSSLDMDHGTKLAWERSSDFANYFCTYGYVYHQKQMLSDDLRMQCYRDAIFENSSHFKDKVVLDVGTGSGILAIWAAQAGARKVYAVEVLCWICASIENIVC